MALSVEVCPAWSAGRGSLGQREFSATARLCRLGRRNARLSGSTGQALSGCPPVPGPIKLAARSRLASLLDDAASDAVTPSAVRSRRVAVVVAARVQDQGPAFELGSVLDPSGKRLAYAPAVGLDGEEGQVTQMPIALRTAVHAGLLRVVMPTRRHTGGYCPGGVWSGAAVASVVNMEAVLAGRQAMRVGEKLGARTAARDQHVPNRLVRRSWRDQVHLRPQLLALGSTDPCQDGGRHDQPHRHLRSPIDGCKSEFSGWLSPNGRSCVVAGYPASRRRLEPAPDTARQAT